MSASPPTPAPSRRALSGAGPPSASACGPPSPTATRRCCTPPVFPPSCSARWPRAKVAARWQSRDWSARSASSTTLRPSARATAFSPAPRGSSTRSSTSTPHAPSSRSSAPPHGSSASHRRPTPARCDRDEQRQLRIETMAALGVEIFVLALVLVLAEAHLSPGGLIGACAILAAIGGITLLLLAAGAGAAVVLIVALCAAMAAMSLLLLARRRILRPQLARPRTGREALVGHHGGVRSEERRGGKEGKCRWS